MRILDRKLLRDLFRLRGQVGAIALVVASGVGLLVMSLSALTSLRETANTYYERYNFAEVFAQVKRAPERLAGRIEEIPGVQTVETRISAYTTLELEGVAEPIVGRLVSLPEGKAPLLNRPALRAGRYVAPDRDNEAVIHEPFAEAQGLTLGDSFEILINGAKRDVRVVGIALSPEFVYAIAPGMLIPDDARFAVVWMGRETLAAAYDLDGAFNDVSLALLRGTNPEETVGRLDPLLERYGGSGAIARADQVSNWFLTSELQQLRVLATVLPAIFLTVAAFLTNTVLARLIAIERREIGLMKAFGFSDLEVALHYVKMALVMALIGVLAGFVIGAALGRYTTDLYATFFRFPFLYYRPSGTEFLIAAAVSLAAALFGALWAVRSAVRLKPAEAMRPNLPQRLNGTGLPRGLSQRLDYLTRILLGQIAGSPLRAAMTVAGIALSIAVLIMALRIPNSIDMLARTYFTEAQHQDVTVGFFEPRADEALYMLEQLPGVLAAEPMRITPADIRAGRRSHRGAVTGLPEDARLNLIADARGWSLPVPRGGVVLGSFLAEKLAVEVGGVVTIEVLEGARPVIEAPVTAIYESYIGMPAVMELSVLNRELGDAPSFEYASLLIDSAQLPAFYAAIKALPGVSSVMTKQSAIDTFYETLGDTLLIFISFFAAFSCALAIGVIYNATRITLSERSRELATLRVLGFTRWEISYILLGEAALLTLAALPLGCLAGVVLVWIMTQAMETELFRVPFVIPPDAYGKAILVAVAAAALSAGLVRRRLDKLDLIAVLKTRE